MNRDYLEYTKQANKVILELNGKEAITRDIDLINMVLSVPGEKNTINKINEFLLQELVGDTTQSINLLNFNDKQNENYKEFFGYDKEAERFRKEVEEIRKIIQECIEPHKESHEVSRGGVVTKESIKIKNMDLLNKEENMELRYHLEKKILELQPSISGYKFNSIISVIYLILSEYIKNNISLSVCQVCHRYFESIGRIGKTGNKYCSRQCSNVEKCKKMREKRARN